MEQRENGAARASAWRVACLLALLLVPSLSWAQTMRTVTGTVVDESNFPLTGATVIEPQSKKGGVVDLDGNFSVEVPASAKVLQVSYIGYLPQTVQIPKAGKLNVKMEPNDKLLKETVVVGYGVQRKSDLTGAVSNVTAEDFNQGVITSPDQLINGKVSGVQIVSSGGSPSAGSTIRIRGGASLNASNDPLIVIDGVPMEVGGSVSGAGNFLALINPNDIESMTVLKDASSTAIYGSRASNGVIIITTKKGQDSKRPKITFSTTNSLQSRTRVPDMLDAQTMYEMVQAQGTERQKSLLSDYRTDWNDEIYRTAFGTDNNLAVSGKLANVLPYRVSLGYTNQSGILKTDNMKRYTGALTLTPTLLDNHLKLNFNLKGTYSDTRFANTSAIWGGATHSPFIPVMSGDPTKFLGYTEAADGDGRPVTGATGNPVGLLKTRSDKSDVYRMVTSLDADYSMHFLPELHAHLTLGYDWSKGKGHIYIPAEAYQAYNYDSSAEEGHELDLSGNDYNYGPQKNTNKLLTFYFNYNKYFESIKSNIDITAGYDYQFWKYTNAAGTTYSARHNVLSTWAADDQRHSLISWYGRLNYSFDGKYLLTASVRRDGSSRFAKNNRWGSFPSVALGWRVSEEKFFEPLKEVVNTVKLRASWGVTGQQDGIANYGYLPLYTLSQPGAYYLFGGVPTATYRPSAYNANLKWETTKAWNFGFDFGILGDRISGSFDYYNRKTHDLLATVPVAAGTNFNKQMLSNVGNIKSEGYEITINATPIKTDDWEWDLSVNATYQKTRIQNLRLNGVGSPDTPAGWIENNSVQVLSEGYAPYAFYVYKQLYDQETGRPIEGLYADLNGDGNITSADLYHYHSPAPDWMLGFTTSVRWKKWTLSTSLRANLGNYVYNVMAMNTGAWETMSYNDYQLNRLNSSYAYTRFQKRQYLSDHYVENASFLKMDNLQLSYNIGKVGKWLSMNAAFQVQNVFTITKYDGVDPEVSGGLDSSVYPRPRIYSLTVGLEF